MKTTTSLPDDFAVFIISHGRHDRVITVPTLERSGYTGPFYIVIDNLDKTSDKYFEKFGDKVLVFDKPAIARTTDNGDNFHNLRTTTHARNACFELARKIGVRYFCVLDDDYNAFSFRFDSELRYKHAKCRNLDAVFAAMLKFFIKSGALSIAMAQGGDYMGGDKGTFSKSIRTKRKVMNSFFCSTDRPFKFVSRLNEDVNTYLSLGIIGKVFLTLNQVSLNQLPTQMNPGGMSEAYLESGTYVKSFYSVMYSPSSVVIKAMGSTNPRLHHRISWKKTVPMIVRESLRKR